MSEPGYWIDETSGKLRPVILAYLHGQPLSPEHVAAVRAYLRQWIMADVWAGGPELDELRRRIDFLIDRHSIQLWLDDAIDLGIDPL